MINKLTFVFLFGLVSTFLQAETSPLAVKPDFFDILEGKQYVSVTLVLNLDSLLNNRFSEEKIHGTLRYKQTDGKELKLSVNVSLRGKFRRRMCGFPPIKLNFNKTELNENQLSKADEYKLVTHCLEGEEGEFNIIKEFLAYQFYQQLTPISYRSKWLKITYQDTKSDTKIVGHAILLEDKSTFEKRMNLKELKDSFSIPRHNFENTNFRTHGLFQYMIGNLDWSTAIAKNLDIFQDRSSKIMFLVPYDFDFSGFVNVAYAVPNKDYNQKKVRDRLLLEAEENDLLYKDEIKKFIELKPVFINIIRKQKGLNMEIKEDLENYLISFYENLNAGFTRTFN